MPCHRTKADAFVRGARNLFGRPRFRRLAGENSCTILKIWRGDESRAKPLGPLIRYSSSYYSFYSFSFIAPRFIKSRINLFRLGDSELNWKPVIFLSSSVVGRRRQGSFCRQASGGQHLSILSCAFSISISKRGWYRNKISAIAVAFSFGILNLIFSHRGWMILNHPVPVSPKKF